MANRSLPVDVTRELRAMARDDGERHRLHDALARLRDDLTAPADEVTERRHLVAMRQAASPDPSVPGQAQAPTRARRRRTRRPADDPSLTLARLTGRIGFTPPEDEELPERLLQAIARMTRAARGSAAAESRRAGDATRSRRASDATRSRRGDGTGESRRDACPPGQGGPPPVTTGGGPGGSRVHWSHRYPTD
ncbi:MAG TPA: hypothetical protein VIB48_22945 [Acidimicrobiia bacterium]|jgi:hypothetical protein